uniref:Uncharacterized protein n=1 Tax=Candidatus Kentrum sp. TUN TaxID=2126343 RepID=A0A450ZTY1_9GAMM|nr:MAG: hypothetical protein BECKTUN1418D_GA0071000_10085 [Candidatus Kentron sp. TUN]VFK57249.1 MAG: hypothetical protein BECKTUN1418F_GA0071002_11105 [Candidatus Kentron sp. TUN]VFK65363.1 MAG: hypothetical protein BECKTUN1418E_GA0071001_11065 [Candidatus Kentron sp. TUN]
MNHPYTTITVLRWFLRTLHGNPIGRLRLRLFLFFSHFNTSALYDFIVFVVEARRAAPHIEIN